MFKYLPTLQPHCHPLTALAGGWNRYRLDEDISDDNLSGRLF